MSLGISYAGYRTGFPFELKTKSANGLPFELWDGIKLSSGSPAADSGADVYGAGTGRFAVTLPELAELFWRIEELAISADYVFYYDGTSSSLAVVSNYAAHIQSNSVDVTDHAFLCNDSKSFRHFGSDATAVTGGELEIDFSDVWKDGDNYYPKIRVWTSLLRNIIGNGIEFGDLDYPVALEVDFINGITIPLWVANGASTAGYDPAYSTTGTITVAGSDFWPYGGKFDPADGSRV
jgi:hypothetical protein